MPFDHLAKIPPWLYGLALVAGALVMITWRFQETRTPVTLRKLIIPPLGMSTGFCMFIAPQTRLPWTWAIAAFAIGALVFAWPLARTSKLTLNEGVILMQRSKAFIVILLALVGARLALHVWIEHFITPLQTGALFFILAFGAIVRWRLALVREFLRMRAQLATVNVVS